MIKQFFTILLFSSLSYTAVCSIDKLELESAIKHLKVKEASEIINKIELSNDEIEHLKDLTREARGVNTSLIFSNLSVLRNATAFFTVCSSPFAALLYFSTRKWAIGLPNKSWFEGISFKDAPDLYLFKIIVLGTFFGLAGTHIINTPFYYYYNNKIHKAANISTHLKNKQSK